MFEMKCENKKNMAFMAVALMVAVACAGVCMFNADDSSAASSIYGDVDGTIQVAPGYRYSWSPSWPSDLSPTLTVEKQTTGTTADGTAVTIASVSGNSIVVKIPKNATANTDYSVVIKASTSNPTQTDYIYIVFHVNASLSITKASQSNITAGDAVSITPTVVGLGTKTYSLSNAPSWLTINSSTGKVTGTSATPGDVSFTIKVQNNYGETASKTVSFHVATKLAPTDLPTAGALIYEV